MTGYIKKRIGAMVVAALLVLPALAQAESGQRATRVMSARWERGADGLQCRYDLDGPITRDRVSVTADNSSLRLAIDGTTFMRRQAWPSAGDSRVSGSYLYTFTSPEGEEQTRHKIDTPPGITLLDKARIRTEGNTLWLVIANSSAPAAPGQERSDSAGPAQTASAEGSHSSNKSQSSKGSPTTSIEPGASGTSAMMPDDALVRDELMAMLGELAADNRNSAQVDQKALNTPSPSTNDARTSTWEAMAAGANPALSPSNPTKSWSLQDEDPQPPSISGIQSLAHKGAGASPIPLGRAALGLLFTAGIAGIGCLIIARMRKNGAAGSVSTAAIQIVDRKVLWGKHQLVLVDVANTLVLLGLSSDGVTMLTSLDPSNSAADNNPNSSISCNDGVSSSLRRTMNGGKGSNGVNGQGMGSSGNGSSGNGSSGPLWKSSPTPRTQNSSMATGSDSGSVTSNGDARGNDSRRKGGTTDTRPDSRSKKNPLSGLLSAALNFRKPKWAREDDIADFDQELKWFQDGESAESLTNTPSAPEDTNTSWPEASHAMQVMQQVAPYRWNNPVRPESVDAAPSVPPRATPYFYNHSMASDTPPLATTETSIRVNPTETEDVARRIERLRTL